MVIFDLGSTLIYENGPWDELFPRADAALWKVLHAAGVTLGPSELYGSYPTLFALYYEQHRGDLNEPTTATVLDELLQKEGFALSKDTLRAAVRAMFAVTQENWLPEQDALATLKTLKERGLPIGLISNASDDDNTQALIDKGGFRPYLDNIISSASFGKRKPDPEIFRAALEYFAVPPEQAVMVGDDFQADIFGAHGVGMQTIWITRRVHEPPPATASRGLGAVVSTLGEIPAMLRGQG